MNVGPFGATAALAEDAGADALGGGLALASCCGAGGLSSQPAARRTVAQRRATGRIAVERASGEEIVPAMGQATALPPSAGSSKSTYTRSGVVAAMRSASSIETPERAG